MIMEDVYCVFKYEKSISERIYTWYTELKWVNGM